jgi:hypothetical protein
VQRKSSLILPYTSEKLIGGVLLAAIGEFRGTATDDGSSDAGWTARLILSPSRSALMSSTAGLTSSDAD